MTIIGVDSSGHVKQPPIYVMAVRISKNKGQLDSLLHVSPKQHEEYTRYVKKMKISHWFEKISAILIFKAVCGVYYAHDSINIDVDFQGKTRENVKKYLQKLFINRFLGDSKRNNPNIIFIPARYDEAVRQADKKSQKAKHKQFRINLKNPNITGELTLFS